MSLKDLLFAELLVIFQVQANSVDTLFTGKPPPDVSWYRGNELLAITKEGSVCQLHLPLLTREMVGMRLQCRVEPPLLKAMYRDVSVKLFCKLKTTCAKVLL